MLNFIDAFLDGITMYRLVLYYLIILVIVALILSLFGTLPFSPFDLAFSTIFIVCFCYISNKIFSYIFKAPTNVESVYITALILTLIITPNSSFHSLPFFGFASLLAISSKYILAIGKKHLFNPVAIAVVLTAIGLGHSASWWTGTNWMVPFVVSGGLLVARKIQKEDMIIVFFIAALLESVLFGLGRGTDVFETLKRVALNSSLLFLGFVMLTEPLTTPPTKKLQILYGALVGFLFSPQIHLGSIYSTPEIALVIGNIFSYIVSPKLKLTLKLGEKRAIGSDILDFVFKAQSKPVFTPGQYMEWTLSHKNTDSRGNRRYFTIASSPTEENIRLGIKFYPQGSSFKRAMANLDANTTLIGSQLAGEFTLPKDQNRKLVFIAGGIGITPYRSIIKYLLDTNEKRDIIMLYSNKMESEIAYRNIFDAASSNLGIKTVYTLTEQTGSTWRGRSGRIDARMITEEVPDYAERLFYLSGPHAMVAAFEQVLLGVGISRKNIKIDFFPGFV